MEQFLKTYSQNIVVSLAVFPVHYSFSAADTDGWARSVATAIHPGFPGKWTNTGRAACQSNPGVERVLV